MSLVEGASEEPAVTEWRVAPVEELWRLVDPGPMSSRPRIVAVDGRSGSGKTSLAEQLRGVVRSSAVVHTDDVAWHHSFFDWTQLLIDGVLRPLRAGQSVSYRPPGWIEQERAGSVEVPGGLELVIIEGVGAGRRELAPWLDAVVWVQSDLAESQRRGVLRDGGDQPAADFWQEWAGHELPFLADQRPWERAAAIVSGTPVLAADRVREVVLGSLESGWGAQPGSGAVSV